MPLGPGARLGPYEIVGPIGAGGMGEVYKARDTRLQRTVAVKVSKEAFTERFRNEALAIAALNHPHICTLHDVGPNYLVMEYVDGKPLRGPVPVPEFLRQAGQIADALEQAHQKGIVHRDLKPSNILVTKGGVKVLDFGLAKRRAPRPAPDETGDTLTEEGTVAGTPRYMAPEQIEGEPADERTDIFALGLVLYELLTGERAFEGKSAASVMAAILEKEPRPISALKPGIPPALEDVVGTCLAKDPAERWQSVRELKHALRWASRAGAGAPGRSLRLWMGLAVAAAGVAVASGVALVSRHASPRPLQVRLQVAMPPKALGVGTIAVSPDGLRIAMSASLTNDPSMVFVRPLDSLETTPVPGTQPGSGPFWSPDGRQLAFWQTSAGLNRVDLQGGPVQQICNGCLASGIEGAQGASWGAAGVIVFSDAGKLFRVAAGGGDPEPLGALAKGEQGRSWPRFLPDGNHYLYFSQSPRKEERGVYVGALDSDFRKRLVATDYAAAYSPPGYLLYLKEDALVAQGFDAARLLLAGEAFPVLKEAVARFPGPVGGGAALFSVSTNGVLAWLPEQRDQQQLTWFDRAGRKIGTIGEPTKQYLMDLSPDERTIAVCRGAFGTSRDIWLIDAASGASRRVTFDPHDDCGAKFSPDGKRIVFFSDRRGVREIYEKAVDGSGDEKLLVASQDYGLSPDAWSADGRFVSYNVAKPGQSHDTFLLPRSGAGEASPIPFLATPAMETGSTLAPNGRYMAYHSNEPGVSAVTGAFQVYVREIAASGRPGPGKWQVSMKRGLWPRFRPDGRELYFLDAPTISAVDVQVDGPSFRFGVPHALGIQVAVAGTQFYVSRDGQRFLFAAPVTPNEPIRALVNWLPPRDSAPGLQ